MKDIEFITRIQVNGEKRELTKEEASELILRRVKEALKVRYHLRTPQKNLLANCKHGKQKRLRRSLTAL